MAIFEGVVSLFEQNGAVVLRKVSSGGYDATEINDLVTDMLELKKPISRWSLWIDGFDIKQAETYSPAAVQKLIKAAKSVELVAVKAKGRNGQFRAPRIKITSPNVATKTAPSKARLGR